MFVLLRPVRALHSLSKQFQKYRIGYCRKTGIIVTGCVSLTMSIYKKGFKQPEFDVFQSGVIFFEQTPTTNNNNKVSGAWDSKVRWSRTRAALTKVPGSILGTHRMASTSR